MSRVSANHDGLPSAGLIAPMGMSRTVIEQWLREDDASHLEQLWRWADQVRQQHVGQSVHLRGLIEISNHCVRSCGYCGLRLGNEQLPRYRMSHEEIMGCVRQAVDFGYGTVVLQSGEDNGMTGQGLAELIRRIKGETPLAVTLSLGERCDEDLRIWREAGADRYLLRFETSDRRLYDQIHPPLGQRNSDRLAILNTLRTYGYEIGSGVMIGIPGQSYASLANDIALFGELDLDMIGVGPYIPHPATPLGGKSPPVRPLSPEQQTSADELMCYKTIALTRLMCPDANIPSTTALATINRSDGRELGLSRGANVVMPNLTPPRYRQMYEIYPGKACVNETAAACNLCLEEQIAALDRTIGHGPGGRQRSAHQPRNDAK